MIDVARNKSAMAIDNASIVNRVRLLMLTEPTELYMNPTYGLGLKRYLFQYNNDNTIAMIRDRLIEQLRLWEPCVIPEKTVVQKGLLYTGTGDPDQDYNHLKLTVTLQSKYGNTIQFDIGAQG